MQAVIGNKISNFLMAFGVIGGGIILAFMKGWKMALVLSAFIPFSLVVGCILACVTRKSDRTLHPIANRLDGNAI